MTNETPVTDVESPAESTDQVEDQQEGQEQPAPTAEDVQRLQAALKKERDARKAAEKSWKQTQTELENAGKSADEQQLDKIRREAEEAALAKASQRVIKSEIRVVAAQKGIDPDLASKLVDIDEVDVSEDGEIDRSHLESLIEELIGKYPTLKPSAQYGSADQGPRGSYPKQLSKSDLENMSPEKAYEAYKKGLANKALTGR